MKSRRRAKNDIGALNNGGSRGSYAAWAARLRECDKILHLAGGVAALPAVSRIARAQTYPIRPVRIVVGFPAGGATDLFARLIGQWLSERLGQSFVIENRSGASGMIAVDSVVRARPDGYTLLLSGTPDAYNENLYPDIRFNYIRDISPVASIALVPLVMEVNPAFPAKTVVSQTKATVAAEGKRRQNASSGGFFRTFGTSQSRWFAAPMWMRSEPASLNWRSLSREARR